MDIGDHVDTPRQPYSTLQQIGKADVLGRPTTPLAQSQSRCFHILNLKDIIRCPYERWELPLNFKCYKNSYIAMGENRTHIFEHLLKFFWRILSPNFSWHIASSKPLNNRATV